MSQIKEETRVQAQIAGGVIASTRELPRKGQILRGCELESLHGPTVRFSDYRGRSALIVFLTDERQETEKLLRDAASHYEELKRQNAELLAIIHGSHEEASSLQRRLSLPYPVLLDTDGRLHRELGARDAQQNDAASIYVTDVFGEVTAIFLTANGESLPAIGEVTRQLEFISFQCPECEAPEWPA